MATQNTSTNVVGAIAPYRHRSAYVLISRYIETHDQPGGCNFRTENDILILSAGNGEYVLYHPQFPEGTTEVRGNGWHMRAQQILHDRAQTVRVTFSGLDEAVGLAIYNGEILRVITPAKQSARTPAN